MLSLLLLPPLADWETITSAAALARDTGRPAASRTCARRAGVPVISMMAIIIIIITIAQ
jgi:hypothetical protein